jgi:hypothetical protein
VLNLYSDFWYRKYLPSEGCSNPQSTTARKHSGFKMKSRNPELWIPT